MKMALKIIGFSLQIFGLISLVAVLAFLIWVNGWTRPEPNKINEASAVDVEFVLNWGGIDPDQSYSVIYSHESPVHPFLGDHTRYYCIQLEKFDPDGYHRENWIAGPELDSIITRARERTANIGNASKCFDTRVVGNSNELYAYIWEIHMQGRDPAGAEIIFYHEATNRLLFVGYET